MRRIINFRPFAAVALIMAGSVFASLVAFNIAPLGISLLAVLGALVFVAAVYFAFKKDKVKAISFAVALIFSCAAALSFFLVLDTRYEIDIDTEHIYSGRVTEYFYTDQGGAFVFVLDGLTADDSSVGGRMRVTAADGKDYDFLRCGYTVTFGGKVTQNALVSDGLVNASGIRSDVRYFAYPDEVFVLAPGQAHGLESARLTLAALLRDNMDETAAGVSYGMLVGDRQYISDEVNNDFAVSGIGHVLSVSGLHFGVLVAALSFLLKKCRVPKAAIPFIIISLLLFYAVFTGGSPSVVRACIMSAVMLLSPFFGRRDLLNSLFLSACICMLISPFYLFECGFIMSFSAVFGLATLSPPLNRLLLKIRLPKYIADALSASTAAQIAIIPSTAFFFHTFTTYSLLFNAIMMPLLSGLFILLIAAVALCLIMPFMSFLLTASGWLVGLMCAAMGLVSYLPAAATVVHVNAAAFIILPLMFAASDFIMIKRRWILASLCALGIIFSPLYADNTFFAYNSLIALKSGDTVIYGDKTFVVGDFGNNTTNALHNARIKNDLYLFVTRMTESAAEGIVKLSRTYTIKQIVFAEHENVSGVKKLIDRGLPVKMSAYEHGLSAAYTNGAPHGWLYTSGKTAHITSSYSGTAADTPADVVRCRGAYDTSADKTYIPMYGSNYEAAVNIFPTSVYGNVVYDMTDGNIYSYT